jgi:hypothetical protein
MNNPYDFEKEFQDWFDFLWDTYYNKLTQKQAIENINAKKQGWELCDGFKYGAWIYKNWNTQKKETKK